MQLKSLQLAEHILSILPPQVKEVLAVRNNVLEGVERNVLEVFVAELESFCSKLLINLGQVHGI
jgi:hypothetical protein